MGTKVRIHKCVCGFTLKSGRKCGSKSASETSIEVAFQKAQKNGWSMKDNKYLCPKHTHAIQS